MLKYIPDYYAFLEIDEDADKKTIKKSYMAAISQVKADGKKYKYINDAYTVLSDDKKRAKYDKLRQDTLNKNKKSKNINRKDYQELKDVTSDIKDKYDLVSKLFNTSSKIMKGRPFIMGAEMIAGGVMAGYGVKKGREYMQRRRGRNDDE
ncbi:MAG: hypothetical protein BZ136_07910 [Methanosphaera sp. rholeuAM74]|nr:MAG: hypothetical protein BZ136_07910 [Methanosphaera sp. rholeuAM74]